MPDQNDEFRALCTNAVEMLVNMGLINSISERWPEDVQDNWTQRMERMGETIDDWIREAQQFASALD